MRIIAADSVFRTSELINFRTCVREKNKKITHLFPDHFDYPNKFISNRQNKNSYSWAETCSKVHIHITTKPVFPEGEATSISAHLTVS